jgi:hypothetical protein
VKPRRAGCWQGICFPNGRLQRTLLAGKKINEGITPAIAGIGVG